jgi:hypothetical protein
VGATGRIHVSAGGGDRPAVDPLVPAGGDGDVVSLGHALAAPDRVDQADLADGSRHLGLVGYELPVLTVDHDLGSGALRERDHGSATRQRLDHHQSERLLPAHGHQQRACVRVQLLLRGAGDLADVVDPPAVDVRLDLLAEVLLLAGLEGPASTSVRPASRAASIAQ